MSTPPPPLAEKKALYEIPPPHYISPEVGQRVLPMQGSPEIVIYPLNGLLDFLGLWLEENGTSALAICHLLATLLSNGVGFGTRECRCSLIIGDH